MSFKAARLCRSTARTTLAHGHNDRTQTKTPALEWFKNGKYHANKQLHQKKVATDNLNWHLSATKHRNAKAEEKTNKRWSSPLNERDHHQRALNCLALQCCKTSHCCIRGHTIRSILVFGNHLEMKFQESRCFVPAGVSEHDAYLLRHILHRELHVFDGLTFFKVADHRGACIRSLADRSWLQDSVVRGPALPIVALQSYPAFF